MAKLTEQSVETGNSVVIMVDTEIIGRAQSLTAERSFGTTGVYEIGSIMPQEHVFLRFEGTVTLNRLRLRKKNFFKKGIASVGEDVLRKGVIDISLINNVSGQKTVLETYSGCSIDTYNTEVRANEIATEEARFYYLTGIKSTEADDASTTKPKK